MIGYKGFDKSLKCRDKQYVIGETYREETATLCVTGMHFCLRPIDVLAYYTPAESRYCEVSAPDECVDSETSDDSKRVTTEMTIVRELTIAEMVDLTWLWTVDNGLKIKGNRSTRYLGAASATGYRGAASATGYRGAASATGDRGAASATGELGAASATGDQGAASATGDWGTASATGYQGAASATEDWGAASATGDWGAASATGKRGAASATGDWGAASATGYRGAASATGDQGAASATGYRGAASATGDQSIACALGFQCVASGAVGCWLVLAERMDNGKILGMRCVCVDGKTIKAGVKYALFNGEIVEA